MATTDQWLFSPAQLSRTPGIVIDKQTLDHELKRRNAGIEFLMRVGLQLKLQIPVLATASVFFHRFYMRQSIDGHVVYDVAGACIFLACKIEETGRKLRDVAAVCQAKATGGPVVVNDQDPSVARWIKTIMAYEELLVETLCFDLTLDHPYHPLLAAASELQSSEHLTAYAWSIINDSFRTPLCILFSPRTIACGAYFLALHGTAPEYTLTSLMDRLHAAPIFEAFALSSSEADQIQDVIALLLDFYAHIQPHVQERLWRMNPFAQSTFDLAAPFSYAGSLIDNAQPASESPPSDPSFQQGSTGAVTPEVTSA